MLTFLEGTAFMLPVHVHTVSLVWT